MQRTGAINTSSGGQPGIDSLKAAGLLQHAPHSPGHKRGFHPRRHHDSTAWRRSDRRAALPECLVAPAWHHRHRCLRQGFGHRWRWSLTPPLSTSEALHRRRSAMPVFPDCGEHEQIVGARQEVQNEALLAYPALKPLASSAAPAGLAVGPVVLLAALRRGGESSWPFLHTAEHSRPSTSRSPRDLRRLSWPLAEMPHCPPRSTAPEDTGREIAAANLFHFGG
mmetsp:Transcript_129114/g.306310  ORF Transcript_129114/g.306310 Transcript_129114/m.306310 type:complete len:223 (-) Transcript_129114:305-973(-)